MERTARVLRFHVSIPEEIIAALEERFGQRRTATLVRRALTQITDPSAHVLHLPDSLKFALAQAAAERGQSPERYAVALLREALARTAPASDPQLQVALSTFALVRHLVLLAVDNDAGREEEIVRLAEAWGRKQLGGGEQPS